jgi:hypothetical protein
MGTTVRVYEYNCGTVTHEIDDLPQTLNVWSDCINALQNANFRPQQYPGQTVRAPGAWTNPALNIENLAVTLAWNAAYLAQPHVHGGQGVGHRAVIGCKSTVAGNNYVTLRIYIGQFS